MCTSCEVRRIGGLVSHRTRTTSSNLKLKQPLPSLSLRRQVRKTLTESQKLTWTTDSSGLSRSSRTRVRRESARYRRLAETTKMAAEQRKLLEQLMGDQLMSMPGTTKQPALTLTDPKVCRSYLCGNCPHDLFTNTKQDLGNCPKAHQPNLKEEYLALPEERKRELGFDFDYRNDIQKYIRECDGRIDNAQRRLDKTAEEIKQTNALLKDINNLRGTIENGIFEVEILAEEGAVNLAVQEFHKLKIAKVQKDEKERELKNLTDTSGPSGHQKLQVCDVCGAYLSRLDNDRRLADHFFGKMHIGYSKMRQEATRLMTELKGRQPPVRDESMFDAPPQRGYDDPYGGGRGGYGGGYGGRGSGGGYRGRGRGGFGPRW